MRKTYSQFYPKGLRGTITGYENNIMHVLWDDTPNESIKVPKIMIVDSFIEVIYEAQ